MADIEQRARELLDLHADPIPVAVEGGRWFMVREQDALDAIVAALPQEVSHKAEARDDFPGLLRALTKVARLDEGEPLWIEPSEAKAVIAALASQAQVPDGYVLVPKRATDAMTDAGCLALAGSLGGYEAGQVYMCWEAMLAAAPAPEVSG
ncbi:hypothetical protein ACQHIH_16220 [Xanthomonas sontii]|uniref:hypothetical protein n=1 Tax=Xanthomonas sontii TaxID=2650745 RepID=UPI003F87296F